MAIEVQTEKQMLATAQRIDLDGLYAVVTGDILKKWSPDGKGLDRAIEEHARALVDGGVHTFEVTCRIPNWLEVAQYVLDAAGKIDGLIPAVGTHANVLTIHDATELGIKVHVASNGLPPVAGRYAVHKEQYQSLASFEEWFRNHDTRLGNVLGFGPLRLGLLKEDPVTIDPIAYCMARNVQVVPSFETETELYNLLNRGATSEKAFPALEAPNGVEAPLRAAMTSWKMAEWTSRMKAMSDVHKSYISICATGGLDENTLPMIFSVPGFRCAGASSLLGNTPDETNAKATGYRLAVDKYRK